MKNVGFASEKDREEQNEVEQETQQQPSEVAQTPAVRSEREDKNRRGAEELVNQSTGSRDSLKKQFQELTGIDPADHEKVREWQSAHGLKPLGHVGPQTLEAARKPSAAGAAKPTSPAAGSSPVGQAIRMMGGNTTIAEGAERLATLLGNGAAGQAELHRIEGELTSKVATASSQVKSVIDGLVAAAQTPAKAEADQAKPAKAAGGGGDGGTARQEALERLNAAIQDQVTNHKANWSENGSLEGVHLEHPSLVKEKAKGSPKCNFFIGEMLHQSGFQSPGIPSEGHSHASFPQVDGMVAQAKAVEKGQWDEKWGVQWFDVVPREQVQAGDMVLVDADHRGDKKYITTKHGHIEFITQIEHDGIIMKKVKTAGAGSTKGAKDEDLTGATFGTLDYKHHTYEFIKPATFIRPRLR